MGRKAQITPRKRAIICQYLKDGLSVTGIARKLKMPRTTVSGISIKFKATGSSEAGQRSGRPRISSIRDDRAVKLCSIKNPTFSSLEIKCETGLNFSTRTIRRRLSSEFGLRARRPAKKPLLNKKQRLKRIQFCKKYQHMTSDDWSHILFSDESTFCQFGSFVNFVRRPKSTRFDPKYTIATVKHSPKIMVWGCFSGNGRGSLYFIPNGKTVNTDLYLDILKNKLQLSMHLLDCQVFQQDSAPAHTSRIATAWFRQNRVKVLEWPGNSPDLNPIENLWMIMKRKIRKYHPRNLQELVYFIKKTWCTEINQELCKRLVSSMPRRLQSVIANKGHTTKY